jgi:hypothetical protein
MKLVKLKLKLMVVDGWKVEENMELGMGGLGGLGWELEERLRDLG